ncbi:MAG: bifunctional folylpolyglutamate synthase/dihydrofolate synthase [Clostridia bacterium]|nr:bifunctional folylpolyglutamate synthase/dihydrofolate synthase [Clostridia bacterium]
MNGKEAVEYIHSVSWLGSRPGLERIEKLCSLMGNPEKGQKFIHVAGTNGKGSFCAMTESILRAAGYKTGLFTSPYVLDFNERIRVNGENISDDALGEVTGYVKSFADKMEDVPTEFELLSAIAFEYFKREGCDFVVLETGMGGRLDSTNIIQSPVLTVITGISLDHTSFLGSSVEEIAREKAGIIKSSRPVLIGAMDESAETVIRKCAEEKGSDLTSVDYGKISFTYSSLAGNEFIFGGDRMYALGLLGEYQIRNAAATLTAVELLRAEGINIPEGAVKRGLETVRWPARFELLSKVPPVIYDGAHNPQGIDAAVANIKRFFGSSKVVLVAGVMADKDHSYMTGELSKLNCTVHTVKPDNPRALDSESLAAEFRRAGVAATHHGTFDSALTAALSEAAETSSPVIGLGSLYMYADFAATLRKLTSQK